MTQDLRVVAFMRAKPTEREHVERAVLACVAPSQAEEGNLSYAAHLDTDDPLTFVVVEHWSSAKARERHLASPHFQRLIDEVDESGRLSDHHFHVLAPLDSPGSSA